MTCQYEKNALISLCTRHCMFGRSTNWDNLSQGQSDINAEMCHMTEKSLLLKYRYKVNLRRKQPLSTALSVNKESIYRTTAATLLPA